MSVVEWGVKLSSDAAAAVNQSPNDSVMNRQSRFKLIELLVVIAIIALQAAF